MKGDWLWWCLWVCCCISCLVEGATDSSDALVMAEMAKNLKADSSWTGNDPCGGWKGISCSSSDKVTRINIQGMGLEGTLPVNFNKLSALSSINMQKNFLGLSVVLFDSLSCLKFSRFPCIPRLDDGNNWGSNAPMEKGLQTMGIGYFHTE